MESLNRRRCLQGSAVDGEINGFGFVDMGEAGIWATCNVGANKPEERGLYFAWGETKGYPDASGDKKFSWEDYKFGTSESDLTKYNSTDELTTLELEDDAAHVNMGGNWRMPTKDEVQKLIELCNTEWTTNYEGTGIKGRIFKLKTDESKQLFFPVAGRCDNGNIYNRDFSSSFLSSSIYPIIYKGYSLYVNNYDAPSNSGFNRYCGASVRGFIPKQ